MSYPSRNGLNFYFEEYGTGVPFIFSHGLGGNLTLARDLIGPMNDVRVIVYDNRGHGRTSGAGNPSDLTFACMADDMAAVLDCLRIESAVIGGESMGAGISLAFCGRHPQRVSALILTRPAWLNTPYPPNPAILGIMVRLIDEFGREQASARFAQSAEFIQLNEFYPETAKSLARTMNDFTNLNLGLIYKNIPASVPFENFEELRDIDVPTLLLANYNDPLHPFDCARCLAAAIPNATLQEVPSKNQTLEEHRRVFRCLVLQFIKSLDAKGRV